MRVLLVSPVQAEGCAYEEISKYISCGVSVVVNTRRLSVFDQDELRDLFRNRADVSFVSFDPDRDDDLISVVLTNSGNIDGISLPYPCRCLTKRCIETLALNRSDDRRLRCIGIPNDTASHILDVLGDLQRLGIEVFTTSGIHASSVAEYTIFQFGNLARRLADFNNAFLVSGRLKHIDSVSTTRLLTGRKLGIIGCTGKDGAAVASLASRIGMKVYCSPSRSLTRNSSLRNSGMKIVDRLEDMLASVDYLSINCKCCEETFGMIGRPEVAAMKRGIFIGGPAGAEVFEVGPVLEDLGRELGERRIGALVVDVPFSWSSECDIATSLMNRELLERGAVISPRVAGYTLDAFRAATVEITERVCRHLSRDYDSSETTGKISWTCMEEVIERRDTLVRDLLHAVESACEDAVMMRERGLSVNYCKNDNLITDADFAVSDRIKSELSQKGWRFVYAGEEFGMQCPTSGCGEVVIDGIDGTRNFRDGNYGWCTSVAICFDGEPCIAVVHDHHCRETYFAVSGQGAYFRKGVYQESRRLTVPEFLPHDFSFSIGSFRIGGSSKRKTRLTEEMKRLGGRGREWGSVALSICAVARGGLGTFVQADSFRHDHIAAAFIAREAGVRINSEFDFRMPRCNVVVCHPTVCDRVFAIFDLANHVAE